MTFVAHQAHTFSKHLRDRLEFPNHSLRIFEYAESKFWSLEEETSSEELASLEAGEHADLARRGRDEISRVAGVTGS